MLDHDTTYTVVLIATSEEYCTDTMRLDILVHPYIEAVYAVDDIIGVIRPVTINNQSIGLTSISGILVMPPGFKDQCSQL